MTPKGYKELGILPEDWEVVRLGDVCEICNGFAFQSKKFKKSGFPIVRISNIKSNNLISLKDMVYFSFDDYKNKDLNKFAIHQNDILVALSGATTGKIGKLKENIVLYLNQRVGKFQPLKRLNNNFLYQNLLLQSELLFLLSGGGAQPNLSTTTIKDKIFISLPSLAEQEKIAEILSTWDRQIQNLQSLITEKQTLKKGLCQTLLSAKIRFKGFIEDWQVVRLGEVCEIKKGEQLNKILLDEVEGYPVINGGILPSGFTSAYNTSSNTITISEGGNSCGFVNYIQEYFWSGGHCYTLQNLKILDMFLFQVLKHNEKKIQMLRVGSGLPNIQKRDLEKFSISIPSKIEQEKIAEILSEADNEITLLEQKLQSLEIQKKGLMQKLLNGKVRVKYEK